MTRWDFSQQCKVGLTFEKLVDVIYYIKWGNSNDHFIRSEVGGKTSDKIQHVYKKNC